ncbi:MAG: glycosyltransferase family 2 protein, partial [bacterium]
EALESILAQTFPHWRLVAVDDASTDRTWSILCRTASRDERVLALKNESKGIVGALNTALGHSRSPFIARMDADDISHPGRLDLLLTLMEEKPAAGVVGSAVALFPSGATTPNMERYIAWQNSLLTPEDMRRERYVESTMTHASALFRRELLVEHGGWREGPFPEDLDLWLRLHSAGVVFVKHPEVLYLWREHDERESRASDRCSPEAFHRCKVNHLSRELRERGLESLVILGPDRTRSRWADSLLAEGFECIPLAWSPGEPLPEEVAGAPFTLVAFGVPEVRERVRVELEETGEEERDWIFVG